MNGDSETKVEVPKKKKSRMIMIIALLVFILAVGAGAFVMLKGDIFGMTEKSPEEHVEEKMASLAFKGIQVNLADKNIIHYLSTTIVIEYAENEKLGEEMAEKSYRLKDAIIEVLREKSVSDLDTGEDITKIKQQILNDINKNLTLGKANSVYFEEFIIQ